MRIWMLKSSPAWECTQTKIGGLDLGGVSIEFRHIFMLLGYFLGFESRKNLKYTHVFSPSWLYYIKLCSK